MTDNIIYGPFWPLPEEPAPTIEDVDLIVDLDELIASQIVALEAELSADPAMADEIAGADRLLDDGEALGRRLMAGAAVIAREGDAEMNAPAAGGKSAAAGSRPSRAVSSQRNTPA